MRIPLLRMSFLVDAMMIEDTDELIAAAELRKLGRWGLTTRTWPRLNNLRVCT